MSITSSTASIAPSINPSVRVCRPMKEGYVAAHARSGLKPLLIVMIDLNEQFFSSSLKNVDQASARRRYRAANVDQREAPGRT